jgi:hypothetical protein
MGKQQQFFETTNRVQSNIIKSSRPSQSLPFLDVILSLVVTFNICESVNCIDNNNPCLQSECIIHE